VPHCVGGCGPVVPLFPQISPGMIPGSRAMYRWQVSPPYGIVCRVGESVDLSSRWDFFVSYTQADQAWAEWIAWVLEEDGYRVLIQTWDFVPGTNWIKGMQDGAERATRTIAVLSGDYLESVYAGAEWRAAWGNDPEGAARKLLAIRVRECERPGLLKGVVGFDLFGLDEAAAEARLQSMVSAAIAGRDKPDVRPGFPGAARDKPDERPNFPGARPDDAKDSSLPVGVAAGVEGPSTEPEFHRPGSETGEQARTPPVLKHVRARKRLVLATAVLLAAGIALTVILQGTGEGPRAGSAGSGNDTQSAPTMLPSSDVTFSFAASRVSQATAPRLTYSTTHLPSGVRLSLQRLSHQQLQPEDYGWKFVQELAVPSGSAVAPAVPRGEYEYRIQARLGKVVVSTSVAHLLYSYGRVSLPKLGEITDYQGVEQIGKRHSSIPDP
jgi:hypothetical protein